MFKDVYYELAKSQSLNERIIIKSNHMENQNQSHKDEQGSSARNQEQNTTKTNPDMPTSAGGNREFESPNQDDLNNETLYRKNEISEDAESRVLNEEENNMEPQIDEEGEFKPKTGWMREEGLSGEERNTAEEEDLNGRRSGDASAL